jgi:hypothetical protein
MSPVAESMTRAVPDGPPDTNSRPNWSIFKPMDGMPVPWLMTAPSPVRRSAA